jgi:cell fate regulator YaaT (PSP1 superfamily)
MTVTKIELPSPDTLPSAAEVSIATSIRKRKSHCTACSTKSSKDGGSCKNCGGGCGTAIDSLQTEQEYAFFNDYLGYDTGKTHRLVEVSFKGNRKSIFKNENNIQVILGEPVIVQIDKGLEFGRVSAVGVIAANKWKKESDAKYPQWSIVRNATEEDITQQKHNSDEEKLILFKTRHLVKKEIPLMKVSEVEWQFDRQKLTVFFTSPERVDFRDLVRQLAITYKARIELRQIHARLETKRLGGIGPCGLELCCSTFLEAFDQVTIEHAQAQQLPNNIGKLSGMCGRLKCCLLYEIDNYVTALRNYPPLDSIFSTPQGEAKLIKIDIFKDIVHLIVPQTHTFLSMTLEEVNSYRRDGKVRIPEMR